MRGKLQSREWGKRKGKKRKDSLEIKIGKDESSKKKGQQR